MDNLQWMFSGIGVEIIKVLAGAIIGGGVGYVVGVRRKISQSQIAADNAKQDQKANVVDDQLEKGVVSEIKQKQKAGNDSKQLQVGIIKNEK